MPADGAEARDARTLFRSGDGDDAVIVADDARSRWLRFGSGPIQSLMDLGERHALVLPYSRAMMAGLLFAEPPRGTLMLGLGGGSFARFLAHHHPGSRIVAIEHDETVWRAAREHFHAGEIEPLEVRLGDARTGITRLRERFDCVLLDLYDAGGMPPWLRAPRFHEACRACLDPGGWLAVNLWVRGSEEFLDLVGGLRGVFGGRTLVLPVEGYQNLVVLAFRTPPPETRLDRLAARAAALERRYHLGFPALLDKLRASNLTRDGRLVV